MRDIRRDQMPDRADRLDLAPQALNRVGDCSHMPPEPSRIIVIRTGSGRPIVSIGQLLS